MHKKNLVCIIDSFAIGGAEMLFATTLNNLLDEYQVTLVLLYRSEVNLLDRLDPGIKVHYLDHNPKHYNILGNILKLRKILAANKAQIIHAQLFWSTIIARLAKPKGVKLVFTIQNLFSRDTSNSKVLKWLEKITYRSSQVALFVTKASYIDYCKTLNISCAENIVPNPIDSSFFSKTSLRKTSYQHTTKLKMVAVGNLRSQKNYGYLLEALKNIAAEKVSVDIYGEGELRGALQHVIDQYKLNVALKGHAKDVRNILQQYDVYIMTSSFEGYGIAVVEAMASNLPVLLSDIEVLREVTNNEAIYFNLNNPSDLTEKLEAIYAGKIDLEKQAVKGYARAVELGDVNSYIKKIKAVFN